VRTASLNITEVNLKALKVSTGQLYNYDPHLLADLTIRSNGRSLNNLQKAMLFHKLGSTGQEGTYIFFSFTGLQGCGNPRTVCISVE
jgi:hypothetical protein